MKNKIGWFAFLLVCGLSSCKTDQKPAGVLDKEKFAEVLVDMYTGEARMSSMPMVIDSSFKLFRPYEEAILLKKGVPDSIMKITYQYYTDHPIEMEQVYDVVIDTLSLREQKAGVIPK